MHSGTDVVSRVRVQQIPGETVLEILSKLHLNFHICGKGIAEESQDVLLPREEMSWHS